MKKYLIAGAVLILALVGVYLAMNKSEKKQSNVSKNTQTQKSEESKADSKSPSTTSKKNKAEELLAMNVGANATQEQLQAFSIKVSEASVKTETLDITSCQPNPDIIQVKPNQPIIVKNDDSVPHKLYHGQGINTEIPAKSQKIVTPTFPNPGIFGYGCDNKINGIFFVVP